MVGALRAGPRLTAHFLFLFLCTGIIGLASTLYNSFLPFLCVFVAPQAPPASSSSSESWLTIRFFSLASRGARFGDSSYYITYRNVRLLLGSPPASFIALTPAPPLAPTPIQQVVLGVIGVPGAFLAGWAVEQPYIGRKGTLAISAGEYSVFCMRVHYSTTPC